MRLLFWRDHCQRLQHLYRCCIATGLQWTSFNLIFLPCTHTHTHTHAHTFHFFSKHTHLNFFPQFPEFLWTASKERGMDWCSQQQAGEWKIKKLSNQFMTVWIDPAHFSPKLRPLLTWQDRWGKLRKPKIFSGKIEKQMQPSVCLTASLTHTNTWRVCVRVCVVDCGIGGVACSSCSAPYCPICSSSSSFSSWSSFCTFSSWSKQTHTSLDKCSNTSLIGLSIIDNGLDTDPALTHYATAFIHDFNILQPLIIKSLWWKTNCCLWRQHLNKHFVILPFYSSDITTCVLVKSPLYCPLQLLSLKTSDFISFSEAKYSITHISHSILVN